MWQKKRNEVKGKSYYYSTINKLKKEKKIDEVFLSRISSLTLEEVIAIKLESAARYVNHKLYNFPIWKSLHYVCREAVLMFALSSTIQSALLSLQLAKIKFFPQLPMEFLNENASMPIADQ